LLNFVLSNCTWENGEMVATFRQPFDLLAETTTTAARHEAGLTFAVANDLATADEQFGHTLHGAPSRLILKPVGGDFLGLVPGSGKRRVRVSELVDTAPAGAGHLGELRPFHRRGIVPHLTSFARSALQI
jgi:hypothetical protein